MALRLSALVIILSSLKLSRGLLVLPRPPSSPNDINQSISSGISNSKLSFERKLYNVKPGFQGSRTNVEKPNTDNYKLLEIELREGGLGGEGGSGPRAINFGEIIREVLREEELPIEKKPFGSLSNEPENFNSKISSSNPGFADSEKLYYLKKGRRISADINGKRTSWEPRSYLKSVGAYDREDKRYATKSFYRPKKYLGEKNLLINNVDEGYDDTNHRPNVITDFEKKEDDRSRMIFRGNRFKEFVVTYSSNDPTVEVHTTENSLPTSSELPKQIPPPPSRGLNQQIFTHTTPVLKFMSRRTDILPNGYAGL